MQQCQNCGAPVTDRFAAVFGDNSDRVHGCLDCEGYKELSNGEAGR